MATVQTVLGVNVVKGKHSGGNITLLEVAVKVSGTYLTASKPNFDVLAALQSFSHAGVSAVSLAPAAVDLFQDDADASGNVYTAPNAFIALSGTGNKVVTFRIDSGAVNGNTGTEVADGTAISGVFSFLVAAVITGEA